MWWFWNCISKTFNLLPLQYSGNYVEGESDYSIRFYFFLFLPKYCDHRRDHCMPQNSITQTQHNCSSSSGIYCTTFILFHSFISVLIIISDQRRKYHYCCMGLVVLFTVFCPFQIILTVGGSRCRVATSVSFISFSHQISSWYVYATCNSKWTEERYYCWIP